MDVSTEIENRNRLARVALSLVLAVVAVGSLRQGKRVRGLLAAVGALGVGYTVANESGRPTVTIEEESTQEASTLECAACGQPIEPGQRRGPNADDEIVHEACLEA